MPSDTETAQHVERNEDRSRARPAAPMDGTAGETNSAVEGARWRTMRALFELLYRNQALYWLASTLPFAGQWRVWQRLVLPRLIGTHVLDVGCGIGTLLVDMSEAGYICSGLDRSPQMVATTRSRLRRRGHALAALRVRQGSVQHIPHADGAFDSVVSTFPTEYIYDPAALAEIVRVLRPDGRLIVVLGAALEPKHVLLLPLVGLQTVVYGRQRRSPVARDAIANAAALTSDPFATRLRAAGLMPRREQVRGPFWQAVLYTGVKPR